MLSGIFANQLFTIHQGQPDSRGLSPRLWTHVAGQALSPDGFHNWYFAGDDFLNFGQVAPAAAGTTAGTAHTGGYGYYVDTATAANSIKQLAGVVGGAIRFSNAAQDNHESWLTSGGNSGTFAKVSDTATEDKPLIFETRFRLGQITAHNIFLGMSEEGLAAADTVADAGTLASKDLLGFYVLEDAPTTLKFGYRKAGQALQAVGSYATALAADTWYKAGFVYNPQAVASKRIMFYVDNVEQTSYVTSTNIAAATFPDGEHLAFLAGLKNGAAAAKTLDLDWWFAAQAG